MSTLNSARPHAVPTRRTCEYVGDDVAAPRPRQRLIADGVIAGYIHDISRGSRRTTRAARSRGGGEPRPRVGG